MKVRGRAWPFNSRIRGSAKRINCLTSRVKGFEFERTENYATGTSVFGLTNDVSGWRRRLGLKGQWLPIMMEWKATRDPRLIIDDQPGVEEGPEPKQW